MSTLTDRQDRTRLKGAARYDHLHKRQMVRYTTCDRNANALTVAEALTLDTEPITPEPTPEYLDEFRCMWPIQTFDPEPDTYDAWLDMMLAEDALMEPEFSDYEPESPESHAFGTLTLDEVNEAGGFIVTRNKFFC